MGAALRMGHDMGMGLDTVSVGECTFRTTKRKRGKEAFRLFRHHLVLRFHLVYLNGGCFRLSFSVS
jgi:hypothetical protein